MKEADWKRFKKILPELRERYLRKVNNELTALLNDNSKTPTEQFWAVEKRTRQEAKILRTCFDGYSRSRLTLHIMNMYHCGIMEDEDIAEFSEDIQNLLSRIKDN